MTPNERAGTADSATWQIAIDFGTTATCVAVAGMDGSGAHLVTHGTSGTRFPSAVFATDDGLVAGALAVNQAGGDPGRFEPTPKRALSRGDRILALGRPVPVVDAVAAVLHSSVAPVRATRTTPPGRVVITHPAAWGPTQLAVLEQAAVRAGLGTPELMAEPLAAACAVVPAGQRATLAPHAIFDWGGGTFDAAVVAWDGGTFRLAGPPRGVDPLGGEDVDELVWQHTLAHLPGDVAAAMSAPRSVGDRRAASGLRIAVRNAKETLSALPRTGIPAGGHTVELGRGELEAMAAPLVDTCLRAFDGCLLASRRRPDELAGVWLVGDATRMPLVPRRVADHLGLEPSSPGDAKGAVALGAVQSRAASPWTPPEARPVPPQHPPPPPSRRRLVVAAVAVAVVLAGGVGAAATRGSDDGAGSNEGSTGTTRTTRTTRTTDASTTTTEITATTTTTTTETWPAVGEVFARASFGTCYEYDVATPVIEGWVCAVTDGVTVAFEQVDGSAQRHLTALGYEELGPWTDIDGEDCGAAYARDQTDGAGYLVTNADRYVVLFESVAMSSGDLQLFAEAYVSTIDCQ